MMIFLLAVDVVSYKTVDGLKFGIVFSLNACPQLRSCFGPKVTCILLILFVVYTLLSLFFCYAVELAMMTFYT